MEAQLPVLADREVLTLFGAFDPARLAGFPRRWGQLFPRSTHRVVPGGAHFSHEDNPVFVARAIRGVAHVTDAVTFENHRPALLGLAWRMLGSLSAAEDVVQEAWLRFSRTDGIAAPRPWLMRVVSRLCLDHVGRASSRREVPVGVGLPEPVATPVDLELADTVSLAFLVVLRTLTPAERAVFLLHEVFDCTHVQIGENPRTPGGGVPPAPAPGPRPDRGRDPPVLRIPRRARGVARSVRGGVSLRRSRPTHPSARSRRHAGRGCRGDTFRYAARPPASAARCGGDRPFPARGGCPWA